MRWSRGGAPTGGTVGQGWLRASHRKLDPHLSRPYRPYHTHDEVQWLSSGTVYPVDVEIWPTCLVIPAGYRIGLSVRGTDPDFAGEETARANLLGPGHILHDDPEDRPAEVFGCTVWLHGGGAKDAFLLLPVIPRRLDAT